MTRPIAKLLAAALAGAVASLSLSLGLIPVVAAFTAVVALALASRSHAAVAGAFIGWGVTWFALFGRQYLLCSAPGAVCGGDITPWIALALGIASVGALAGIVSVARMGAGSRT